MISQVCAAATILRPCYERSKRGRLAGSLPAAKPGRIPVAVYVEGDYIFKFARADKERVELAGLASAHGAVAQLVRVLDCRSSGCGFESRRRRLF